MHTDWKKLPIMSKFLIFLKEWLLNTMKFFDRIRNRFSILFLLFFFLFILSSISFSSWPTLILYIYNFLCVYNILCIDMVYNAASQHKSFFALWLPPFPTALCEPHNCSQAGIWAPRSSGRIPSLLGAGQCFLPCQSLAFTTVPGSEFF